MGDEMNSIFQWKRLESAGKSKELRAFLQTAAIVGKKERKKEKEVGINSREGEGLESW
jgi:hypothetical protein